MRKRSALSFHTHATTANVSSFIDRAQRLLPACIGKRQAFSLFDGDSPADTEQNFVRYFI